MQTRLDYYRNSLRQKAAPPLSLENNPVMIRIIAVSFRNSLQQNCSKVYTAGLKDSREKFSHDPIDQASPYRKLQ